MKKAILLIDVDNLNRNYYKSKNGSIDFNKYIAEISKVYNIVKKIVYFTVDRADEDRTRPFIGVFKALGFIIKRKEPRYQVLGGRTYSFAEWNVAMAIEAVKSDAEAIVLGSNDTEFVSLANYCNDNSIELALFAARISNIFRRKCQTFDLESLDIVKNKEAKNVVTPAAAGGFHS